MGVISELCNSAILLQAGHIILAGDLTPVIEQYLRAVTPAEANKKWPRDLAPGGDKLKLRSISLSDTQGLSAQTFRGDSPIQVDLHYEILQDVPDSRIGIRLLSTTGGIILASTDSDTVDGKTSQRKAGKYRSSCIIPANLLNFGQYSIAVAADIPMREVLIETGPLVSFEVDSIGAVGTRHSDHRPGYLRPRLAWDIQCLETFP